MTQDLTIEVNRREVTGKSANRRLRREEMIPAVVYGGGKDPISIQVARKTLIDLFKSGGSENRIFLLKLAGTDQTRHARSATCRSTRPQPGDHLDFSASRWTEAAGQGAGIELDGVPYGVKTEAACRLVTREAEIERLPSAIPAAIHLDVSELQIGQHIEARCAPRRASSSGDLDAVVVGEARQGGEVAHRSLRQ
jgi:large subunit ribosomal protein L25